MADLVRRWVRGPLDSPQRPVSLRTRVSSFPQLSPLGLLLQVNLALKFPLIALPFHKEALIARVIFSFPPSRRLLLCKVTASNASPSSLPLVPCQWRKEHTPGAGRDVSLRAFEGIWWWCKNLLRRIASSLFPELADVRFLQAPSWFFFSSFDPIEIIENSGTKYF